MFGIRQVVLSSYYVIMQSQIFTIQLDYWSDMQKEIFWELMEITIKTLQREMEKRHKKNSLDYAVENIEWTKWVYEWTMKYKWYYWIDIEDFYFINKEEIDKHLKNSFTITLRNIYDDIREDD